MIVVENAWVFYALFPLIAFLYASVGHGGASGYLALMALFGVSTMLMKPTALLLNLFVAGISFYHFYKQGFFKWKLFYPFALGSIPASFIGGYLNADPLVYKKILAILLLLSVARLMLTHRQKEDQVQAISWPIALAIGAGIGFFSGLIGIGGGIILSPVLLLFNWANMKETAALSALFIWINSLSGLSGMLLGGASIPLAAFALVLLVLLGGWLGARFGSRNFPAKSLKLILATVLVMASIKLLLI